MRVVRQTLWAECGLACLVMVLGHYKVDIELAELRSQAPPAAGGTKVRRLVDIAARYGVVGRAVRAELEDLPSLALPAILHWDFNHYVVLEQLRADEAVILDPAAGRRRLRLQAMSAHFTGVAIEFRPSSSLTPTRRLLKASLADFWSGASGLRRTTAVLFLLSLVIQALLLVGPVALSTIIDSAIAARSPDLVLALAGVMLGLAVLAALGDAVRRSALASLGARLNAQMNLNLVRHLLSLGFPFFLNRKLNDVLVRVDSTRVIKDALTEEAIPAIVDGVFALCTLAIVFRLSPAAGAILAGAVLAYAVIKHLAFPLIRERTQETLVTVAAERGILTDTLRGIATVKVMGAEPSRLNSWCGANLLSLDAAERRRAAIARLTGARAAIGSVSLACIVVVLALMVISAHASIGLLMAVLLYRQQFQERALQCVDRIHELRLLGLHLERLADITTAEPEVATQVEPPPAPARRAPLQADGLWFRHSEDDPWILRGASLEVQAGEFVAICGRSGCGKTTLLRLLTGLLPVHRGAVSMEGEVLCARTLPEFRQQIGVVMQDDHLFSGSVLENIAGFDIPADFERAEAAARAAAIHEEIEALPMGYLTLMGDMGSTLSGGQRQRLFLARALYRRPKILLLDEGTANLDQELEALILRNVRQLGLAVVCVAHRQAAIEMADRVLTLSDGALSLAQAKPGRPVLREVGT